MINVLVVEDEYWIRQGILKAIDWVSLGMRPCGEAQNGLEALQILEKNPADIIITDMKMPGMNGDDLLRELAAHGYRGGLIVLSEYSNYDYMRQAIRSQVDEYMLKPIDEQELNDVLLRIRSRLLETHNYSDPVDRLLEEFTRAENITCFTALEVPCAIGFLWAENLRAVPFDATRELRVYHRLLNDHESLLAFVGDPLSLTSGIEAVCRDWCESTHGEIHVGLSAALAAGRERDALSQACVAANYTAPGRQAICYTEIASQPAGKPVTLFSADVIAPMLENLNLEAIDPLAAKLMRPFSSQTWVYLPVLHNALLEMNMLLDRHCRAAGVSLPALTGQSDAICKIHSLSGAQRYVAAQLRVAADALRPVRAVQNGDVVEQMAAYLKEHYAEDMNLLSLSEQYHINYIYLSRLFKKRTGRNFTDYLLELRMAEAHRLISTGTLLIKDVAELVGYPNPYYFTTSYQKYFHRLPTDDQPRTDPSG